MNNPKKQETIANRQGEQKRLFIEHLKKAPILQIACEKISISRATYYRWRNEDINFRKSADEAIAEGEALITDMSESQLITLIRDRNFSAVKLWLQHHHPTYAPKLEITARQKPSEELTPEQEETVRRALRFASMGNQRSYEKQNKK